MTHQGSPKSPRPSAQILIYLDPDSGEIRAEMPSPSGVRRKLDLDPRLLNTLAPDLLEMNTWLRDQEQRRALLEREAEENLKYAKLQFDRALHRKVWDQTATAGYTPDGKALANRVIGPRNPDRRSAEDLI